MSIGTRTRNSYIPPPPVLTALLVTRSSKKTRTTRKARVHEHQQTGQGITKLPTQALGNRVVLVVTYMAVHILTFCFKI